MTYHLLLIIFQLRCLPDSECLEPLLGATFWNGPFYMHLTDFHPKQGYTVMLIWRGKGKVHRNLLSCLKSHSRWRADISTNSLLNLHGAFSQTTYRFIYKARPDIQRTQPAQQVPVSAGGRVCLSFGFQSSQSHRGPVSPLDSCLIISVFLFFLWK